MEKGNLSIREVKENKWESLFHSSTDMFQFSLGLSCQAITFFCCHILGCQAFKSGCWCFPQNDVMLSPAWHIFLQQMSHGSPWVTGENPVHPLLSASGHWIQSTSKQLECSFFSLGRFLFQFSELCPCPWLCWESRASATSCSHTGDVCRAPNAGWEQQCVLPATCWATQPPGWALRGSTLQGTRR